MLPVGMNQEYILLRNHDHWQSGETLQEKMLTTSLKALDWTDWNEKDGLIKDLYFRVSNK